MAYVNVDNTNRIATTVNRQHSRCCCPKTVNDVWCNKCRPASPICCLQATMDKSYSKKLIFNGYGTNRQNWEMGIPSVGIGFDNWSPDDDCDSVLNTNLCGQMTTAFTGPDTDPRHLGSCGWHYSLSWTTKANTTKSSQDCDEVIFQLDSIGTIGTIRTIKTVSRDWWKSPLELDDPYWAYMMVHGGYDGPVRKMTITNCEKPVVYPNCGDTGDYDGPVEPPCDSGCWPFCVMCPEPKALAIVFDDSPSCCLSSYNLTYNADADIYELLGTPVGGPVSTCGQIVSASVSCHSSSSIRLTIRFKDWDGNLRAEETHVLTVTCDGVGLESHMESSSVPILGATLVCGEFIFDGGLMRVISL